MGKSKVETYLGFCVRARKICFGVDEIESLRKGVFLLLADGTLGESSLKKIQKAQQTLSCPLIVTENGRLGALLYKPAVKAVAIKDKNLALAIISACESELQFKLYSGGNS